MRNALISLGALTMLAFATPAMALTAFQTVQKEIVTERADGTVESRLVNPDSIVPGDRVVYALNFENDGAKPASDLVLTMPVPTEITYIDGSASTVGSVVTYSANGETFAPRASLRIIGEDGVSRAASAEDITHIRWVIAGPVQSGETGQLYFKGTLK